MSYLQQSNQTDFCRSLKKHSIFNDPHGLKFSDRFAIIIFSRTADRMKTKKDISRQYILEVSSELVASRGVETSLADIAAKLGISKGTLYYYYPSKSDLIFDITNRHFDQITSQVLERISHLDPSTSPEEAVYQVMQVLIHETVRGRLHHYLIEEALASNPRLIAKFKDKYKEWKKMILEGLDHILEKSSSQEAVSNIILATIDGLILQNLIGIDDYPLEEIAKFIARG
jgi:Transcriptional regulator